MSPIVLVKQPPGKSNLHALTFVSSFASGDNVGDRLQLLPRPSYWLEDLSSWLDPIFQGPAHMYLSQDIPASYVILKIILIKPQKDQPSNLMELLNLSHEVSESFLLLLWCYSSLCPI